MTLLILYALCFLCGSKKVQHSDAVQECDATKVQSRILAGYKK